MQRNSETCSCKHCCSEKPMRITYSECAFVALSSIQCVCSVLSAEAYSAVQYICTLSRKRHDLKESY